MKEQVISNIQGPVWMIIFNPESDGTVYGFTNSKELVDEIKHRRKQFEENDEEDAMRPEFHTFDTHGKHYTGADYAKRGGFRGSSVRKSPRIWVTTWSQYSST